MNGETGLSIFRRVIDGAAGNLSPGAADAILRLHFSESDQMRLHELAAKNTLGALATAEAEEYDGYIAAADVLPLWKSKARLALKQLPTAV